MLRDRLKIILQEDEIFVRDMTARKRDRVTDDGGSSFSKCVKKLAEEYKGKTRVDPHGKNGKGDGDIVCDKCLLEGTLLFCCGKGCQRRYHPSCLDPLLKFLPIGFWHCLWCVEKKIKLGVHSVSKGVESILDSREVVSKDKVIQREYFVKYQDLAHAHNCWIPEKQILIEAPKLLKKYKNTKQVVRWKKDWSIPHRLLLKRKIILSKKNAHLFDGNDDNDLVCQYEWLVKWTGLGYDHVTWELDDASFMTSSKGKELVDNYESRQKKSDGPSTSFEANEESKVSFTELSELSSGDSPGLYNQHLSYVNRLRMHWHKGQSAVIVDDQIDQERVRKMILFILSLSCDVKKPFLIISTSTGLSAWETEFLHLAPSANLVVYKGKEDVRRRIRALDFYNEDGGILFQILLSSSDSISEDLHALRCIPWEAIVIDECQRPMILRHIDNFSILAADIRRLLLVSGQIKEDRDYIKLLSFLKSGHDELHFSSGSISNLQSELEQYTVLKCNSVSSRFIEYWVPAQFSSMQLKQYCSMLLSNSMLLCSGQRSDSVGALRELVISTKKCCNHPYLLNPSLNNLVTRGLPVEEHFDIGIKASGKLQLLEKILFEAKSRKLRVIILFQSSCGSRSIGDILDDVLCHRFGEDCYVRYCKDYIPSKNQAALDTFNDRESGTFVFLIENRACTSSIKLSSVDTIILFDSDLDPQNDLKCVQKMSISANFKQLTVLRLYSYFTVEEKVLALAKEGIALDRNMQLNQSSIHTLLKWGASYLFSKFDDSHGSGTSVSASGISDQSILNDVICELSSKLACDSDATDSHGQSFISRVKQNGGEYARNISLLGEREMMKLGNDTHAFSWSDLLKGRNPHWNFLPVSSQRIRKTVEHFPHTVKGPEYENDAIIRKKRTESMDNVFPIRKNVSKDNVDPEERAITKDNIDPKRRKLSKEIVDSKHLKKKWMNKKSRSAGKRKGKFNGAAVMKKQIPKQKKLHGMPKSTKLLSKPDISGLCDVLHFSTNVKAVAIRILEYVFENYNVNCREVSTVHAFEISVCWIAASLLKHKIDRKHSLDLAKRHLNFDCKEEEATDVYHVLKKCEKDFSSCLQNEPCVERSNINGGSGSLTPELQDSVEEENQKGFQRPHVLNLVKSATNDPDLPRKSPTTVLFSQDQIYTENIHNEPYMAHEISTSQKTPGNLSVEMEVDATSMESEADERINVVNSVAAEVSSLEHWDKVPNSSNDINYVSPVTGSLERQSHVVNADITQFDGRVFIDPQTLMNQLTDIDNSLNMSTHPAQLHNVETDTVTFDRTAVPDVRQRYSTVSPVCGVSTTSGFAECPLPYMQLSHANLTPFPQTLSASPSFMEDLSRSVMPLDRFINHNGRDHRYIRGSEERLQALYDPVELASSSFVSPVTSQPSSYAPWNENAIHVPHDITNPGYMSSDPFQAHYVTYQMPHVADPDPLLIEMERIRKMNECAVKTHEEKILQLQSDYKKEFETLCEKHCMMVQNVNTAVALKNKELETQRDIVLMNMILADVWVRNDSSW